MVARGGNMGKADVVTKKYMSQNEVFADTFNFLVYDGEKKINPKALHEMDTSEYTLLFEKQKTAVLHCKNIAITLSVQL